MFYLPDIMSEKFSLLWNDYRSNWEKTLSGLQNNTDFADVTLISDDKVRFSAHKILLSSCSNMLKDILKENHHGNSLIYLSGMSSDTIQLILDYIYIGEAKLYQGQLDSFLKNSKKLEIDGLFDLDDIEDKEIDENQNDELKEDEENSSNMDDVPDLSDRKSVDEECQLESEKNEFLLDNNLVITDFENLKKEKTETYENTNNACKHKCKLCKGSFNKLSNLTRHIKNVHKDPPSEEKKIDVRSMTPGEIKDKLKELYKKFNGVWICLECDYKSVQSGKIKRHIETHVDGLSYTCSLCNKDYGTKNRLWSHIGKVHTNSQAEQKSLVKVDEQESLYQETFEEQIEDQKLPEDTKNFIVKVKYDSDVHPITSTDLLPSTIISPSDKINVTSMTPEEIEEQKKRMYQKIDNIWRCLDQYGKHEQ